MLETNLTRKLTLAAMLSALSIVLVLFIHFPIFPVADYLEYDPADVPILIGGLLLGPGWGLVITIIVSLLQALTISSKSGLYGFLMHVVATGVLVMVTSFLYRRIKGSEVLRIGVSFILGVISATYVMAVANLIITPYFTGFSFSTIKTMLFPIFIPFNLIKLGGNTAITFFVYKFIKPLLDKR